MNIWITANFFSKYHRKKYLLPRRPVEQRRNMTLVFDTRCTGVPKHTTLSYFHILLFITHTPTLKITRSSLSQFHKKITLFFQILSKVKSSSVFSGKWRYSILEWKRRVYLDPFPNQHITTKIQSLVTHHQIFHLKYLNLYNQNPLLHGVIHAWKYFSLVTYLDTIV